MEHCLINLGGPIAFNENIELIEVLNHMQNFTAHEGVEYPILRMAIRIHAREARLPTLREISEELWQGKMCSCLDGTPRSEILQIFDYLLAKRMTVWNCEITLLMREYHRGHGGYPGEAEFNEIVRSVEQFHADPEAASNDRRVMIGVDITAFIGETQGDCGLCSEAIAGQGYHLPCGHGFHAREEDCIPGTVKKWFEKNVRCPMCRVDLRDHGAPALP